MRKYGFLMIFFWFLVCFPVKAEDRDLGFLTSTEVFNFSALDLADEEVSTLTGKIQDVASQSSVLYLDWEFRFSSEQLSENFDCSGRVRGDSESYVLPMNTVTNHFLLSVITGLPERYPFNSVSCMLTGGNNFTIRIKGFFAGSIVDIPTAVDVELRPIGLYGNISNPFTNME
ncbi:hypothetical protein NDI52_28075 [Leptolyngbya sp. PL-A3]|uniref:hypothetical protein n=1 Tax=Leptolyngbya sp. PL-A3 TaxID=2933911 RepID=UPI00329A27E0